MEFDIGIWWHWLFVAGATLGSAWNACRVFFAEFDAGSHPLVTPALWFWYELAGSMAGWMSLWAVLPFLSGCRVAACDSRGVWINVMLTLVAAFGVFGQIPHQIDRAAGALGRLGSRLGGD